MNINKTIWILLIPGLIYILILLAQKILLIRNKEGAADQSPDPEFIRPDHMTERNQAAAMKLAAMPFAYRVKSIFNLLDKITTLESESSDLRASLNSLNNLWEKSKGDSDRVVIHSLLTDLVGDFPEGIDSNALIAAKTFLQAWEDDN